MFQDEGVSTDVTGIEVLSRRDIMVGKGARRGGANEKPCVGLSLTVGRGWGEGGRTKYCINDVMSALHISFEVFSEWYIKVFELCC